MPDYSLLWLCASVIGAGVWLLLQWAGMDTDQ